MNGIEGLGVAEGINNALPGIPFAHHFHVYPPRLFFDQMSYFTTQEVGNPMQIIKYFELPRFQPILKH